LGAFAFLVTVDAGAQCFCWDEPVDRTVGGDNGGNSERLLIAVCLCGEHDLESGREEQYFTQPVSFQETPGPPSIHGGVSKRGWIRMKAMRGRIVLQSTSCEITQSADLFREALGARARPRAAFFSYRSALSNRFLTSLFSRRTSFRWLSRSGS
jgi:hypothetical protein